MTRIGPLQKWQNGKWAGAVYAAGKIFGIPCNECSVLCIDPTAPTTPTDLRVTNFGEAVLTLHMKGERMWSSGAVSIQRRVPLSHYQGRYWQQRCH